jgi:hypothetical protein
MNKLLIHAIKDCIDKPKNKSVGEFLAACYGLGVSLEFMCWKLNPLVC